MNQEEHVHAALNHGDVTTWPEEVRFPARVPDSPRRTRRGVRPRACRFAAAQEMQRER